MGKGGAGESNESPPSSIQALNMLIVTVVFELLGPRSMLDTLLRNPSNTEQESTSDPHTQILNNNYTVERSLTA
jgi:hypothetical protein